MDNKEVNYPDILPQEQPPTHLSLSCNSRVKIDVILTHERMDGGQFASESVT